MRRSGLRSAVVFCALMLPSTLGLTAAQAAPAITVVSEASLQAGGAGLGVRVSVVCARGLVSIVDLQVRQRPSGSLPATDHLATSTSFVCTGTSQVVAVGVRSETTKLRTGAAFVRAGLTSCNLDGCLPRLTSTGTVTVVESAAPLTRRRVSSGTLGFGTQGIRLTLAGNVVQRADGAADTMAVTYTCTNWPSLTARLAQVGPTGAVTVGGDGLALFCDGVSHTDTFLFSADAPLARQPVFITVEESLCQFFCGLPRVQAFEGAPVVTG